MPIYNVLRSERSAGNSRALRQAQAVVLHHLGSAASRLTILGGGLTNYVFHAEHHKGDLIIRLGRGAAKLQHFLKEQWATVRARQAGIPTPHILEVGNDLGPFPYMVQRRVKGHPATDHPERLRILRDLGRYSARINGIRTTGFGSTFEWSDNELSRRTSWTEFLTKELLLQHRFGVLTRLRMLSPTRIRILRDVLAAGDGEARPCLVHGDLRLKNVLVDDDGAIAAIIDWENCTSNLAPQWELSIALHDLSIDAKEAFLDGYGLSVTEVKRIAPLMKALNILNYADAIERAAQRRDKDSLDRYRMRLGGILDLYSL